MVKPEKKFHLTFKQKLHHPIPTNIILFCGKKAGLVDDGKPLQTMDEVDPLNW